MVLSWGRGHHVVGHFTTWIPHGPVMGDVATMLLAILQHEFPMVLSWGHGHHVVGHFTTWLLHGHVMGGVAIMLLAILQHEFHMDPSAGRGTKNLFLANHMIFPCLSPLHGKFMDSSCGWPFYNMNLHVVKRPTTCCVWPGGARTTGYCERRQLLIEIKVWVWMINCGSF